MTNKSAGEFGEILGGCLTPFIASAVALEGFSLFAVGQTWMQFTFAHWIGLALVMLAVRMILSRRRTISGRDPQRSDTFVR